ncbi:uncharacterized protein C11orf96-like [Peromyscus leucopus]|uniref:uncharacterized protein C11orf96-like n=1 Tax=Peromyscus leucopus TaxID=10041 RepID=UPI001884FD62|nr:uncharacterized protein C11orf96-like [Peromyscus leucopus]
MSLQVHRLRGCSDASWGAGWQGRVSGQGAPRLLPPPLRSALVRVKPGGAGGAALTSLRAVPAREGGAEPLRARRSGAPPGAPAPPPPRRPLAALGHATVRAAAPGKAAGAGPEPGDSPDPGRPNHRHRNRPTPAVASWGPGPLPVAAPRQVLQLPALPTWALRLLGWHLFALPQQRRRACHRHGRGEWPLPRKEDAGCLQNGSGDQERWKIPGSRWTRSRVRRREETAWW